MLHNLLWIRKSTHGIDFYFQTKTKQTTRVFNKKILKASQGMIIPIIL